MLWFFFIIFMPSLCSAAPIDESLARQVAENFLAHVNSSHLISSIETLNSSGQQVGYLVTLSPQGYIVVAGDDVRVPVKGYSLTSSFSSLPAVYITNILRELEISPLLAKSTMAPQTENSSFWEYLKQSFPAALRKEYVPDTYLLTTQWNQGYPYNKFTPLSEGENTVTGCVQTAVAQMMRYHKHPATGSGVFEHTWNGQALEAVMVRPFNWDIMPDKVTANSLSYEQDEVAALMIDIGILNEAYFGRDETSAGFDYPRFQRAFGYGPISSKSITDTTFFDTIRSEIDNLRPVLLVIPGHMTIADGYASDPTGKKIHVNMGWGGSYDDYYYLDQTIIAYYTFPPNHYIYYNIRPCAGAECQPYPPAGNALAPQFIQPLNDLVIRSTTKVRVDARDPDGDPVTFSASSSCPSLTTFFDDNILTLATSSPNTYCQVTAFATSQDGTTGKTFNVLSGDENTYMGKEFDIAGQFASQVEVDEFSVFLGNATTISGSRGYYNQAFYIWVKDQAGNTVIPATDEPVSATFVPGYYTIAVSISSQTGSSYSYSQDYSNYILSIAMDYTVEELAAALGLTLPMCQLEIAAAGDGDGTVHSQPSGIDCGNACSQDLVCNSEVYLSATAAGNTSLFTGWTGAGSCSGTTSFVKVKVGELPSCTANFTIDAEQDGMPDSWENQYGLNPSVDDSHLDADNDGFDNITEYRNGTPPVTLPGDMNGDDSITVADAILGLKVIVGEDVPGIKKAANVNDDGTLGLAEVLFCLRQVSGL